MNNKISVVVPVYNVEKYLDRCISSIANQTYKNLEIILVDDGSTDSSGEILESWEKKDPRIKVVHKENGGQSSARNAGLKIASGAFVGFVDSDDYIHPQMYEKLYAALVENHADVSICSYQYIDEKTNAVDSSQPTPLMNTGVFTKEQIYKKLDPLLVEAVEYILIWNRLYRRSIFDKIQFKEGFSYEDELFAHHLFSHCNCIATISDAMYMYVQRAGSLTKSKMTIRFLDSTLAFYDRYQFFQKIGEKTVARNSLRAACWHLESFLLKIDGEQNIRKIRKTVAMVTFAMIKKLDYNVLWLIKSWFKWEIKRYKTPKVDKERSLN